MGSVTRSDTTRAAARASGEVDGRPPRSTARPRLSYRATQLVRPRWWRPSATALVWIALLIVYVLWGSTYLAIRVTVETMPPLISAGTRFLAAAAVLAVGIAAARRTVSVLRISRRQLLACGAVGILLLTCGNGGVVIGEQTVPPGVAALLVASVPLWVVVLRFSVGDRTRLPTVAGVLLGFVGLAVLALPGGTDTAALTVGTVIILGASLCWASGSFLSGRLPLPNDAFVTAVWQMAIGGSVLWVLGVSRGELAGTGVLQDPLGFLADISVRSWSALGWLILAGSVVAYTAYAWLLQNASISLVSTYAYVNPVVAVVLGALILNEAVTAAIFVGGAIVVLAVVVVVSTERPREAEPDGAVEAR
jgi:drug/metabolite transporter (DMT)-like permease